MPRHALMQYRREHNLCVSCGQQSPVGTRCVKCTLLRRQEMKRNYVRHKVQKRQDAKVVRDQRRLKHACVRCSRPLELSDRHVTCPDCRSKYDRVSLPSYVHRELHIDMRRFL